MAAFRNWRRFGSWATGAARTVRSLRCRETTRSRMPSARLCRTVSDCYFSLRHRAKIVHRRSCRRVPSEYVRKTRDVRGTRPRSRAVAGDEVTEAQLQRLIGLGCDPVDGSPLGRAYPVYQSPAGPAPTGMSQEMSARRRAVAGYDFTFSIPKSASV
ncbi:MAG: relaxase domain-containing protein, partial [Mycetocola sp.]